MPVRSRMSISTTAAVLLVAAAVLLDSASASSPLGPTSWWQSAGRSGPPPAAASAAVAPNSSAPLRSEWPFRGGSSKTTTSPPQSAAVRRKRRPATAAGGGGGGAARTAAASTRTKQRSRAAGAAAAAKRSAQQQGGGAKTKSQTTAAAAAAAAAAGSAKMPTLFPNPDETKYDRYAACLAATEGLRRARDAAASPRTRRRLRDMESRGIGLTAVSEQSDIFGEGASGGGWLSTLLGGVGDSARGRGGNKKWDEADEEEYRRASAAYVLQSAKIVRALGLTVPQFNQLGREVGSDPVLKERVMEQAYLYRMAATLSMAKVPLIEDPASESLLRAHRRRRVQMFARSMIEIEELRTEQTERLRKALNVDMLPEGVSLCDPAVQPLLSPKVRAVCEAFPLQAEEIIKKYGLNSDEFNRMLDETRANPIFRWRVKKYMGKKSVEGE